MHHPGMVRPGGTQYAMDADSVEEFLKREGANSLTLKHMPMVMVCFRAYNSASLDNMLAIAEDACNAVITAKHSRDNLDRQFVALTELDAVIASYIMMEKHPNELTEIAILIQRLVTQNNRADYAEVFNMATGRPTSSAVYDNTPQVHSVYMLQEDDEDSPDTSLPAELTVDIKPLINGRRWQGMILDSGASTSVIIRDPKLVTNLNASEAVVEQG